MACGGPSSGAPGALVEQACEITADGYTVCEPSAPLPPGATPPPPATVVLASDEALAGVALGTPSEAARAQLAERLGEPAVEETSCQRADRRDSLDVPLRGERLTWHGVTAYTTRMAAQERVLTGWHVTTPLQEPWRYDIQLPYGIRLQEPVKQTWRKLPRPGSEVPADGRDAGLLIITTPDMPALAVVSLDRSAKGDVYSVWYDPEGCR